MVGAAPVNALNAQAAKVKVEGVSYWYAGRQTLSEVNLALPDRAVTVLFGLWPAPIVEFAHKATLLFI